MPEATDLPPGVRWPTDPGLVRLVGVPRRLAFAASIFSLRALAYATGSYPYFPLECLRFRPPDAALPEDRTLRRLPVELAREPTELATDPASDLRPGLGPAAQGLEYFVERPRPLLPAGDGVRALYAAPATEPLLPARPACLPPPRALEPETPRVGVPLRPTPLPEVLGLMPCSAIWRVKSLILARSFVLVCFNSSAASASAEPAAAALASAA